MPEEVLPMASEFTCPACGHVTLVEPRFGHLKCACGRGWWLYWELVGWAPEEEQEARTREGNGEREGG